MAKSETKRKRLPKELQDFKKHLKELDFKERVKAYFDCSPFQYDLDEEKMDIIYKSFSRTEKEEFASKYEPIYAAIDRYGDRIRAIDANCFIYSFYIDTVLRQKSSLAYTADFLNKAESITKKAQNATELEASSLILEEALKWIASYKGIRQPLPPKIIRDENNKYNINTKDIDNDLFNTMEVLKGILSLVKCYIVSLKEFLEWVGTPELFPKEFADMEHRLSIRFHKLEERGTPPEEEAKEFPLFHSIDKAEMEYTSIVFDELPLTVDIFGENNLFANKYKSFFNF